MRTESNLQFLHMSADATAPLVAPTTDPSQPLVGSVEPLSANEWRCCGVACPTASRLLLLLTTLESVLVVYQFVASSFIFGCLFVGLLVLGLLAWKIEGPLMPLNAVTTLSYGAWQMVVALMDLDDKKNSVGMVFEFAGAALFLSLAVVSTWIWRQNRAEVIQVDMGVPLRAAESSV